MYPIGEVLIKLTETWFSIEVITKSIGSALLDKEYKIN